MPEASLLDRAPITRRKLDVDEYHRMGEAGRQTVEERFSLTTHAPRFLDTLRRTVNVQGRRN